MEASDVFWIGKVVGCLGSAMGIVVAVTALVLFGGGDGLLPVFILILLSLGAGYVVWSERLVVVWMFAIGFGAISVLVPLSYLTLGGVALYALAAVLLTAARFVEQTDTA